MVSFGVIISRYKLSFPFLFFFILCNYTPLILSAQVPDTTALDPIITPLPIIDSNLVFVQLVGFDISGNRKTKDFIIKREIQIKQGDTVSLKELSAIVKQSQELVYNTNLFAEATIDPQYTSDTTFILQVKVRERLYIYPSPQFHLIDRSFNEWVKVYNADLNRVTYGAKYTQYNLSGRRDVLRVSALTGYLRNLQLSYSQPFSNRKLTEGFGFGIGFTQIRELAYRTAYNNRFINYVTDGFIRNSFGIDGVYFSRKGYYASESFGFGVNYIRFTDDNFTQNFAKEYYDKESDHLIYPDFSYSYRYTNVNNINYPLTGKIYGTSVLKRGLQFKGGANLLRFDFAGKKFSSYGKNWFGTYSVAGAIKLPFQQSFINRRSIGYGNLFIRGLDTYVIDGVAAAVGSYTLRKKLLSFNIPVPIKNKYLKKVPFQFYAKTYTDFGYNYSTPEYQTRLSNRFLYTGGIGIDMLTFYDIVVGVDISANQLGEKGLFLRVLGGF